MDSDPRTILNEVDELLNKLDKLPDSVRQEALTKLKQKLVYVASANNRGRLSSYSGRGRPRGRGRGKGTIASSSLHAEGKNTVLSVKREIEDAIIVKEEIENAFRIKEQTGDAFPDVGLSVGDDDIDMDTKSKVKREKEELVSEKKPGCRRRAKKVDYRQLAEYGLSEELQESLFVNQAIVPPKDPVVVKRSRGRPKKNTAKSLKSDRSLHDILPENDGNVDEIASIVCNLSENVRKSSRIEDIEDPLDLLESCLKESGIKDGKAEKDSKQSDEAQNTELEEENEVLENVEVKDNLFTEGETEESPDVYICDKIDSLSDMVKKKPIESKYKCDQCGKMYITQSVLKAHQIRHKKKEDFPFACVTCDFKAASKIELFRHSFKHKTANLFVCEICGNTFSRDTSLREHLDYVHNKPRKLQCGLCEFSTSRRSTMRKHIQGHNNNSRPVIACPICGAKYKSKNTLRSHLFSHAGAKPFSCDICGKNFTLCNRLVAHKLQVHGPKTHNCSYCPKSFPTIHHLKRHERIHTGEKPYKCCFCPSSCNTQGNLIKHIRQVHEKINFTYKDFLRCSGKGNDDPPLAEEEIEELNKEGQKFAQTVIPSLGKVLGHSLTVDELKEKIQKEKDAKLAFMKEEMGNKKKRKLIRKAGGSVIKLPKYYTESDGKITTLYTFAGNAGDGNPPAEAEQQHPTGDNITNIGDNQYWLTHTDDNGCIILIPWDVSLMGESEDGVEEGDWSQQNLQENKIFSKEAQSPDSLISADVPRDDGKEILGLDSSNDVKNIETVLGLRSEKCSGNLLSNDIEQLPEFGGVVRDINSFNVKVAVGSAGVDTNVSSEKKYCKRLPESIQVIASNEPVDDAAPSASNFVLPEGYIVNNEGQVIHLANNVIDPNIFLRQMGQAIQGAEAPAEVKINKITSNVYSLMSQGTDGEEDETYVITTAEGDAEELEKKVLPTAEVIGDPVNRTSQSSTKDDQQSALVLIVDADDMDKS